MSEARNGVQLVPDVRRTGTAGRYIYYRRGEVLIRAERWNEAHQVLGPPRDRLSSSLRSRQRRAKHENRQPFGFCIYPFDEKRGPVGSVDEAIDLLAKKGVAAERNYVSPPSPMSSHAVAEPEPAELAADASPLGVVEDCDFRVAVLDTGRPHYESAYRSYYRERFGTTIDSHGGNKGTDGHSDTRGMFVDNGTKWRKAPKNEVVDDTSSDYSPGPDIDTMITPFGRLTHPHAGHGLFVSSIVARHAPGVTVLALATTSDDSIADLFEILVDLETTREVNCRIVNMSLGFYSQDDACPPSLTQALDQMTAEGRLVVASAGNAGRDRPIWPAAHEKVVAVAATDDDNLPAEWSNYGSWVTACARGQEIVSDYVFADWDYPDRTSKRFRGAARWSGTSFSAPLVAALIARRAMNDGTGPLEAWEALRQHATPPRDQDGNVLDGYGVLLRQENSTKLAST